MEQIIEQLKKPGIILVSGKHKSGRSSFVGQLIARSELNALFLKFSHTAAMEVLEISDILRISVVVFDGIPVMNLWQDAFEFMDLIHQINRRGICVVLIITVREDSRGHLGTELQNKCSLEIHIKNKNTNVKSVLHEFMR